jgi:hypothetical protein
MPKLDSDCSTQSIQVLVLSNISSSPNKQELGHVGGPKQTGQTLQLYITKGWTENPINKSTRSRFSTTKPSSRDNENIFFLHHKQNNRSKLQMPSTKTVALIKWTILEFGVPLQRLHSAFNGLSA